MSRQTNKRSAESGVAFVLITVLVIFSVGLVGAFFSTSLAKVRHVRQHESEMGAYNAAEAAMNVAVNEAWTVYNSAPPALRFDALLAFLGEDVEAGPMGTTGGGQDEGDTGDTGDVVDEGDTGDDGTGENLEGGDTDGDCDWDPFGGRDDLRAISPIRTIGSARCQAFVREIHVTPGSGIDVEFVSFGQNPQASRALVMGVRFGLKVSEVFDNAYFINNFGWLWGAGITVNGSVRANGNFSLKNPTVNGDIRGAENEEIGALGYVEGDSRIKDTGWYNKHYDTQSRPSNPSAPSEDLNDNGILDPGEDENENGQLDTYEYLDGFDGESEREDKLGVIDMPYLGDLKVYREMAINEGGTLSHKGVVVIDAVHGDDPGESENFAIVGTKQDPIVIDGPVVIENDVVLKGYITGRGTIYAGRNLHLVGDVMYANPPVWPKPMYDADAVRSANKATDLVGFCAKGSVILGDYTQGGWQSTTQKYQSPPFTVPYIVDPTDAANGYASYYDEDGVPWFDGDYLGFDGGLKEEVITKGPDKGTTKLVSRKFFESSFSYEFIHDIADNQVQHIDGVIYTNHLLSGKIGKCQFNGALVSRDEALIYSGSITMNYDVRVRYQNYEFLESFLPREPTRETLYFRQGL